MSILIFAKIVHRPVMSVHDLHIMPRHTAKAAWDTALLCGYLSEAVSFSFHADRSGVNSSMI